MPLTPEEVLKIAKLARIAVNEKEVATYAGELSKILEFVSALEEAHTEEIVPMAHPATSETFPRSDIVSEKINRASFQKGAPDKLDGYYLVPQVIE